MVSASNASILAASGIGSLMGRQGQAPRPFSRIHRQYGTPFWSVASATGVIVALIVVFIGLFPAEGGVIPFDLTVALPALGPITFTNLGLTTLTGFATLNLLLPLSVVNIALIYSRRRYPDIERGFRVPGVPLVPIIGVIANVALITNLPVKGVVVGVCLIVGMLAAYLIWGGKPDMDELYEEVVPSTTSASQVEAERAVAEADTTVADVAETDVTADASGGTAETPGEDSFRILVPVARPDRAVRYARLAAAMAEYQEGEPFVDVLTVTQIPEQTPYEAVEEITRGRITRIQELLAAEDLDVSSYAVEGHTCRDVGFDIVQTARDKESNLVLMGYPEEHTEIALNTSSTRPRAACCSRAACWIRTPLTWSTSGPAADPPHGPALAHRPDGRARRGDPRDQHHPGRRRGPPREHGGDGLRAPERVVGPDPQHYRSDDRRRAGRSGPRKRRYPHHRSYPDPPPPTPRLREHSRQRDQTRAGKRSSGARILESARGYRARSRSTCTRSTGTSGGFGAARPKPDSRRRKSSYRSPLRHTPRRSGPRECEAFAMPFGYINLTSIDGVLRVCVSATSLICQSRPCSGMTRDGDDTGRRIASRRGFLSAAAALGTVGLAGCGAPRADAGEGAENAVTDETVQQQVEEWSGSDSTGVETDHPYTSPRTTIDLDERDGQITVSTTPCRHQLLGEDTQGRSVGAPRGLGVADAGHGSERPRPVAPGNRGNPTGDHLRQLGAQPPAHLPRPRAQQGLDGRRRPDDDGPAGRARRGVYLRD